MTFRIRQSTGFTLVEVMVAMVIGMIATIVMFQVFSASEERKRATTGAGDTQSLGNITLLNLQNQIARAGYGFTPAGDNLAGSVFGCVVQLRPSGVNLTNFAPVVINHPQVPPGNVGTDTLLIVYGAGTGSQEGSRIVRGVPEDVEDAGGGGEDIGGGVSGGGEPAGQMYKYSLTSNTTYHTNDMVIAVPANAHPNCHANIATPLVMGRARTPQNEPGYIHAVPGVDSSGGSLYNLGPIPGTAGLSSEQVAHARAYRLVGTELMECDLMASAGGCVAADPNWVSIAPDIVSLRAEYRWLGGAANQDTPTDDVRYCRFAQIRGIQLVIVARHPQLNKAAVTTQVPRWAGSARFPIDLTADPQWSLYRYTTFETLAPIRNVLWMGELAGCPLPPGSGG